MRNLIKTFAVLTLMLFGASSCMQHNGDIGEFFGTWKLTSITIDGQQDISYEGTTFFQFQTDVIRISRIEPHQLFTHRYGQWTRDGETLCLDFGFTATDPGEYEPPMWIYLQRGKNLMHIVNLTSRDMVLTLQDPDLSTIEYRLHKQ